MGQEMNRGAFLIIALSVLAFSHLFTGIVSAAETVINCRAHDGKCRLPLGPATVTLEIEPPTLFLIAKRVDMGWLKNRQLIYRIGTVPMLAVGGGGDILAIRESHPKSTPGTLTQANIDISLIELIL